MLGWIKGKLSEMRWKFSQRNVCFLKSVLTALWRKSRAVITGQNVVRLPVSTAIWIWFLCQPSTELSSSSWRRTYCVLFVVQKKIKIFSCLQLKNILWTKGKKICWKLNWKTQTDWLRLALAAASKCILISYIIWFKTIHKCLLNERTDNSNNK